MVVEAVSYDLARMELSRVFDVWQVGGMDDSHTYGLNDSKEIRAFFLVTSLVHVTPTSRLHYANCTS